MLYFSVEELRSQLCFLILFLSWGRTSDISVLDPGHRGSYNTGHRSCANGHIHVQDIEGHATGHGSRASGHGHCRLAFNSVFLY